MKPVWSTSNKTYVWVFNTGRGLSICIRMPGNHFITYDLGCSDDFSPVDFFANELLQYSAKHDGRKGIAQLVVSHPHVDHIQEAENFNDNEEIYPGLVTAPNDSGEGEYEDSNIDFGRIENDDNKSHIDEYKRLYGVRRPPLMTLDPANCDGVNADIDCGLFFMKPPSVDDVHPTNDHLYVNGLSLCLYYRHNRHTMWLCGDVTPEVHSEILESADDVEKRLSCFGNGGADQPEGYHSTTSDQPSPADLFKEHGLDILVAPHHGLQSGYSEELYESLEDGKTTLNVVSEKRHTGENDGEVDARYSSKDRARGLYADIDGGEEHRRMVSTRNGHHILIILGNDSPRPKVFLRKNAGDLLNLS